MAKVWCAVKAIVERDNKFLILKQDLGDLQLWDLPGGRVDHGENPYDTLHREVQEEAGLEIDIVKPLGLWWFMRRDGDQVVCTTFLCRPKEGMVDIDNNVPEEVISDYKWVSKEEFLEGDYPVSDESLNELVRDKYV